MALIDRFRPSADTVFKESLKPEASNTNVIGFSRSIVNGPFGVLASREQFPINRNDAGIFDRGKYDYPITQRDFDPDPMNPLGRRRRI